MQDHYANKLEEILSIVEKAVKDSGQKKCYVFYSAYRVENDIPVNNLNEIAATGKVQLFCNNDSFFGGNDSQNYLSPILENPTWLEVCMCANQMITTTKDYHHIFLENIKLISFQDNVAQYKLIMGS